MKLLFYCTKAKPYLVKENDFNGGESKYKCIFQKGTENPILNGYIVAEAEIDRVENINLYSLKLNNDENYALHLNDRFKFELYEEDKWEKTGLTCKQLKDYLKKEKLYYDGNENIYYYAGYAIYLKNVKAFYEPRKLNYYGLKKSPQNMCYARYPVPYNNELDGWEVYEDTCIISIQPEPFCQILNGEKTIEIRTKILKTIDYIRLKSRRIK